MSLPQPTLDSWIAGEGVEFTDEDAREQYRKRAQRYADAVRMDGPDRVPVSVLSTFYPAFHHGITPETAMNDGEQLSAALLHFAEDLDLDVFPWSTTLIPSAESLEAVDYRVFDWPGDGSSPDTVYQAKEPDYMSAEDYDAFIRDPTDFLLRHYVPAAFGELGGLAQLPQLISLSVGIASVHPFVLPFGLPEVQEAFDALEQAGEAALEWQGVVGATVEEIVASGHPQNVGGITLAPYDMLGDTIRGTRGVMMDLKRRPDTLLEAIERITPWAIELGITTARVNNNPHVFIPLHKGADSFMSPAEFEEFYWPQLRTVIEALHEEGLIPWLFAEGSYESRLEIIAEYSDGPMVWHFQNTDMGRAAEVLGDRTCIAGNVPTSLLYTAEPEKVRDYSKELVETVGENGFVLAPGVGLDEAKPENVRAMVNSVR
ncbi:Uroporphyrinogen-III decarboxylase [Halalkaliarchaeum sp. AArc-CO]|uniref:uroporphyrinogen decarboxylase family protein n=1 Tax=Halalkaliarchaeum sp. AArc-CO TaxID=2866381 RepID=UPI00217D653C|nr:uroporphyrinogen decarboxylase family protein [Halalkaliarchaeum sp. AArc-CO]UWG50950.1 Uroporphyrinogen-III decarboxylase [Halalkaliarchaeum sp. AArc-CO]